MHLLQGWMALLEGMVADRDEFANSDINLEQKERERCTGGILLHTQVCQILHLSHSLCRCRALHMYNVYPFHQGVLV
jgi:hypothetical protein